MRIAIARRSRASHADHADRASRASRPRTRTLLATVISALVLALGTANLAQAYPGPGDDRMISTPTQWTTWQNIDPATLSAALNQGGYRLTDLRVSSTSPLLFTATAVVNSGAYGTAWWWYYGQTGAQVGALVSKNNARLISAVRYGNVYAVVMVTNTGSNGTAWWWYDTDFTGISTTTQANHARVTNIMSYAPGRYVVVEVDNTAGYPWGWYAGISLSTLLNVTKGRTTLDVSYNNDGSNTFDVAMIAQAGNDGVATAYGSINDLYSLFCSRAEFVAPYGNGTPVITALRQNC